MTAYYNEIDPYAAQWLRNLVKAGGLIAAGDIDERSILDVSPRDLRGYAQCHFFAGIGGWSLALRLAGWGDERQVWTGSCPCQPLSSAGLGRGHADERHLWPAFHRLIAECRPAVVFGEQVASKDGREWFAAVRADLERLGYACGAADLPAASVGAPHIRQRLWFVAKSDGGDEPQERAGDGAVGEQRPPQRRGAVEPAGTGAASGNGVLADAVRERGQQVPGSASGDEAADGRARWHGREQDRDHEPPGDGENGLANAGGMGRQARPGNEHKEYEPESGAALADDGSAARLLAAADQSPDCDGGAATGYCHKDCREQLFPWSDLVWLPCSDGRARPTQPGLFPLAHGVPQRVGRLRAYGNAIVPQVAAEFIKGCYRF